MKELVLRYFAPFQAANVIVMAASLEEALDAVKKSHAANGYCIPNREVKTFTWGGENQPNKRLP